MADTAAFFANKKKKKKNKPFSFNANKIDVTTVATTVHVDAPALSTDDAPGASGTLGANPSSGADAGGAASNNQSGGTGEQWDDEAYVRGAGLSINKPTSSAAAVELLDMKALDPKRSDQSNIAEKLRVEETKAQLANARKGMEQEAARIKAGRDNKGQKTQPKKPVPGTIAPRFAGAAANLADGGGASGGKWVPPHMRGGGMGGGLGGMGDGLSRVRLGGAALDTQDESLFPDLASADKIVEQQKNQPAAYHAPKKTPVGGGATWASKPLQSKAARASQPKPATAASSSEPWSKKKGPVSGAPAASSPAAAPASAAETPAPVTAPAPAVAAAAPAKPLVKKTKKKKKDLSTFKPTG